jgi:hypothetical protein
MTDARKAIGAICSRLGNDANYAHLPLWKAKRPNQKKKETWPLIDTVLNRISVPLRQSKSANGQPYEFMERSWTRTDPGSGIKLMISLSVADVLISGGHTGDSQLAAAFAKAAVCSIYVVRDGDTVFYVGKSDSGVLERLGVHLGEPFRGRTSKSDLGLLIEANLPESKRWIVELYTADECRWAIPQADTFVFIPSGIAESCLIRRLRPCLNVAGNYFRAAPLPAKYKRPTSRTYL